MKLPLPRKEIGPATIYGEWDDCIDYQFVVVWGESGDTCTVLLCSGCDYGGGITKGSSNVPVKELEAVINNESLDWYQVKSEVETLVTLYP